MRWTMLLSAIVGYLRRSKINTWVRERSRPITVKVTIETSGVDVHRPTNSHSQCSLRRKAKRCRTGCAQCVLRASSFYANSGRQKPRRRQLRAIHPGHDPRSPEWRGDTMGRPELAGDSRPESTKHITV